MKRPLDRPPKHVRRFYQDFECQAERWDKPRRVVAKIEWHPGDLFPRVGYVVTKCLSNVSAYGKDLSSL